VTAGTASRAAGPAAGRAARWRRPLAAAGLALATLLAGCAADKPKPTPLEPVSPQIGVRAAWQSQLDGVAFPLGVAVAGERFVVAGSGGSVVAFQARDGQAAWRGDVGAPLTAGVGSDGRFAAVVTRDNELVVLDQGRRVWSTRLASRTTTAPLVAGERVFVLGVDRVVHAFDALDGRRLWTLQRPGEALTLAQPGVIAAHRNTLIVGLGAVMLGVEPTRGNVRWEVAVTSPRGTNEVERLNDLVGPVLRVGDTLCARAFQTAVGCVDAGRPALRWNRIVGGANAIGGDAELVFGADGADRISAWRAGNGELAWTNERLLYRGLSAPAVLGRSVVFGDVEGQVHFLARDDGRALLRLATDGSAVVAQPVVAAGTMLVVTRKGGVFAYRAE